MRLVPPFNNGLLSNELVLSVRDGPGRVGILPPVSRRCCDSKELEINLGYNNFFCGPRPTTRINQISSFRASALAPRSFLLSHSRPRLDALAFAGCHSHPTFDAKLFRSFSRRNTFRERSPYAYLRCVLASRVYTRVSRYR